MIDKMQPTDSPVAAEHMTDRGNAKNIQYIKDRCDGTSKYDPENVPPCSMCMVPPCVKYCPGCLEQNCCCEKIGSIGCIDIPNENETDTDYADPATTESSKSIRSKVFSIALGTNCVAWLLTLFATLSISSNHSALSAASLSHGTVINHQNDVQLATVHIGLKAFALTTPSPNGNVKQVLEFDEFCTDLDTTTDGAGTFEEAIAGSSSYYVAPDQCDECSEVSGGLVSSLIMSLFTAIPTIATDILRMYPNYDVNCQKFFGTVIGFVTMMLTLQTYVTYEATCFKSFYDGLIAVSRTEAGDFIVLTGADATESDSTFQIDFQWQAGIVLICLYLATVLKIVDITMMILIPTPTITRNKEEQARYEEKHGEKNTD